MVRSQLILAGLLAVPLIANSQNFSVRLGLAADGAIQNWPIQVQQCGTNTNVSWPWLLMTQAQLDQCFSTNRAAYTTWESNKTWTANSKRDANLSRIIALFQQIPAARVQMQTISTNTSMTQAQAIAAVRQEANVIDGILEELQRLGPVLRQIYKPEEDE